jgi:hypothetical protein
LDSHSIEALSHAAGIHIALRNTPEWNATFPRRLPPLISFGRIVSAQNRIEFCASCPFLVPHGAGTEPTPLSHDARKPGGARMRAAGP